jgi:hypothetical protein
MLSLANSLVVKDDFVEKIISVDSRQFIKKVRNAVVETYSFSGVPFQPIITKFNNSDYHDEESVVFVPIIPQYFHNYFEIFSKIIYLKDSGELFKVVFIHNFDTKDGDTFKSIIRGSENPAENAGHWKEFLEYVGIDFICLTPDELQVFRARYTYLFYNDGEYGSKESYIYQNNKRYALSHFLVHPNPDIIVSDMEYMRGVYPKHSIIEGKKIYISRKKTVDRKWDQEDILEQLLIGYGYTSIFMEDLTFLEQIKTIQEASHIVCLYGSALVNCSLCSDKTKILSINITKGYRVQVYDEVFSHFNINHHLLNMAPIDSNTMLHIEKELLDWEKQG